MSKKQLTIEQLLDLHTSYVQDAYDIMRRKNHDYSTGGDPTANVFRNFESSFVVDVDPKKGILLRVLDKIQRLNTFIDTGRLTVIDEGYEDAIKDVINYMILLAGMIVQDHLEESPDLPQPPSEELPFFDCCTLKDSSSDEVIGTVCGVRKDVKVDQIIQHNDKEYLVVSAATYDHSATLYVHEKEK